jgi:hypothetical protein
LISRRDLIGKGIFGQKFEADLVSFLTSKERKGFLVLKKLLTHLIFGEKF